MSPVSTTVLLEDSISFRSHLGRLSLSPDSVLVSGVVLGRLRLRSTLRRDPGVQQRGSLYAHSPNTARSGLSRKVRLHYRNLR